MTLDLSPAMRENITKQPVVTHAVVARDVQDIRVQRCAASLLSAGATVAARPNGAGKHTHPHPGDARASSAGQVTVDGLDLRRDAQDICGALVTSAISRCS